jgi:hypothetical protein
MATTRIAWHDEVDARLVHLQIKKQRAENLGEWDGHREPDDASDGGHLQAFAENHPQDVMPFCAQGHADADFV